MVFVWVVCVIVVRRCAFVCCVSGVCLVFGCVFVWCLCCVCVGACAVLALWLFGVGVCLFGACLVHVWCSFGVCLMRVLCFFRVCLVVVCCFVVARLQ